MPVARSTFVTVVGWIFTAIAGATTLISILQNILVAMFFSSGRMQQASAVVLKQPMPPFFHAMFEHMRLFVFAILTACVIKLVASIGLLNRLNWARLLFIGLLVFDIAFSIGGIVVQQIIMGSLLDFEVPNAPAGFRDQMRGTMIAACVFGALFALGFAVLYGWIIKRLISPPIVAEFT